MSVPLWLRERLGPRVRYAGGSLVRSGSPARYQLHADARFWKTVSAITALATRHMPIADAKSAIERMVQGHNVLVDLPMLEDAARFESELGELGIAAARLDAAAAAEG